jgi:hypothetical protein
MGVESQPSRLTVPSMATGHTRVKSPPSELAHAVSRHRKSKVGHMSNLTVGGWRFDFKLGLVVDAGHASSHNSASACGKRANCSAAAQSSEFGGPWSYLRRLKRIWQLWWLMWWRGACPAITAAPACLSARSHRAQPPLPPL